MILIDTGPLVALIHASDGNHVKCKKVLLNEYCLLQFSQGNIIDSLETVLMIHGCLFKLVVVTVKFRVH